MEFVDIGTIRDKAGDSYSVHVRYRKPENSDRTRFVFKLLFGGTNIIGELHLYKYDDERYAQVDEVSFDSKYRNRGVYQALIPFVKEYLQREFNIAGVQSQGKQRNEKADFAWSKVKNVKTEDSLPDENGKTYKNYTLERLMTFEQFKR